MRIHGVLVVAALLLGAHQAQAGETYGVEITASSLNVRTQPNGTYLGFAARGDRHIVTDERRGWLRISWQGRRAWISGRYARRLTAVDAVVITPTALHVRRGGSTAWPSIGITRQGQQYVRLETRGGWHRIQYDRRTGWLSGRFARTLKLRTGTTTTPPDPTPPVGAGRRPPMQATPTELEILARICKGEASVTSFEGKVAVCAVVLNRVRDWQFPNTIRRVAHQRRQFSAYNPNVRNRLYWGPIPRSCWDAARAALAGQDPTGGALWYFNPYLVLPRWARNMKFLVRIGTRRVDTHDFYTRR